MAEDTPVRFGRMTRRRTALVVGLAATLSVVAIGAAAPAAPSSQSKALSPLASGERFFAGKSVTVICLGTVGSSTDLWSRFVAPLMGQYLHANFTVENITAGGGIPAQDAIAHAAPDGLTFGLLDALSDISVQILNQPGLNFNPVRLAFLGGPPSASTVWVARPGSAYTTWKAIEDSSTPVTMLDVTTGTANFYERVVDGVFGIKANIITGYSNAASILQGFLRGDGPIAEHALATFAPAIEASQAVPIMLSKSNRFSPQLTALLKGVPTLAQVATEFTPKTKAQRTGLATLLSLLDIPQVFAAPSGTPPVRLNALEAALKAALQDKAMYPEELAGGLAPGWVPGSSAKIAWLAAARKAQTLGSYLGA